jgi:hypothetical protein
LSNNAPPPPGAGEYRQQAALSAADERMWATLIHLGGIIFGFLPALIGYLALRDRGDYVRRQTATALNFQLTMLIASIVGAILIVVVVGLVIVAAVSVLITVFSIIAAVRANKGEDYRYPLSITFVR